MPNWCSNRISITGEPQEIEAFIRATTTPEGVISACGMLTPRPTDEGDDFDWYSWSVDHWGTKWPDEMSILDNFGDTLILLGDTAWAPPIAGYASASEKFPTLEFTMSWDESGMCFMGAASLKAGEVLGMYEIAGDEYPVCNWDDDDEIEKYQETVEALRDKCIEVVELIAR